MDKFIIQVNTSFLCNGFSSTEYFCVIKKANETYHLIYSIDFENEKNEVPHNCNIDKYFLNPEALIEYIDFYNLDAQLPNKRKQAYRSLL